MPLIDNHGRPINYVRLAVTDRCNLRCFYCMPAEGIQYVPRKELLSYEEMLRLLKILSELGISKLRITGGEPFVRRDLIPFLKKVRTDTGIQQIHLTTNGVLTERYIPDLLEIGIHSVNLSLDTLDQQRFFEITRRDEYPKVFSCLEALLKAGIKTKINAVVMEGKNIDDILPMVAFTQAHNLTVRFIEEMPFNGTGKHYKKLSWNHRQILQHIQTQYPDIEEVPTAPFATSKDYQVPGHKGTFGIIAAFSRTFCGSCNRVRITAQGGLKTCLYDEGVLDLKSLLRSDYSDEQIAETFSYAIGNRAKNGFEAEARRTRQKMVSESMSTIGG